MEALKFHGYGLAVFSLLAVISGLAGKVTG